jgi:hypothetical protein
MEYVEFNGVKYPSFQAEGNAARWIMPLAKYYCVGNGLDVGYSKYEWKMPGAFGIEPAESPLYDAMNLPDSEIVNAKEWDYIFSSHCLEHIKENWANVLDYWLSKIRVGGVLFLYLPHASQEYWNTVNNRKHIHQFTGEEISKYLKRCGCDVYLTPVDFNNSFAVIATK